MAEAVVIDASALVDLLLGGPLGRAVSARVSGHGLHGPAHLDAEVLSALGRLHRAGELRIATASAMLHRFVEAPIERHALADLVEGAWARRATLRLADALYIELAARLDLPLVTTDARLRHVRQAEVVTP